ncbi:MAG TPA: DUF6807 family protein [Pirellulaceae bacterium]|nr:DUF6807 family protein [Pirellulaceae bacterium]
MKSARLAFLLLGVFAAQARHLVAAADGLQVAAHDDRVVITHGEQPVATWFQGGDTGPVGPYFAHVHAPGGISVTRHFPPRAGIDAADHDTMHPGIRLSFGDLDGVDFWRNKAGVRRVGSPERPAVKDGVASFAATNVYYQGPRTVCREECRYTVRVLGEGYLLTMHSRFSPAGEMPLAFGDQEEMGLGVRVATPLTVKAGGTITNSLGGKNEKEVWGKQADWCDYSGTASGRRVGMLLIPHRDNFRRSWFHARDYGFVAANPFGQQAFTRGDKSRVEVKPGEHFDLRFGVWVYSTPAATPPDLAAIAAEYQRLAPGR